MIINTRIARVYREYQPGTQVLFVWDEIIERKYFLGRSIDYDFLVLFGRVCWSDRPLFHSVSAFINRFFVHQTVESLLIVYSFDIQEYIKACEFVPTERNFSSFSAMGNKTAFQ